MKRFLGGVAAVLVASIVVSAPAVNTGAAGLVYPAPMAKFPVCQAADQEFCIEKFEFTPTNGAKQDLTASATDSNSLVSPFIDVMLSPGQAYTGPSGSTGMGGMFPSLSINYTYIPGIQYSGTQPTTLDGIQDGAYRTVLRIGDYDPSYLFITGKHSAYTVTKGTDGYFTVDVTVTPTPIAKVVAMFNGVSNDETPINNCNSGNWVTNCEPNQALRRYSLSSFSMAGDAAQRELLRGTWLSTNASVFSLGKVDFTTGVFDVTAKGPHYVPTDFGVPGLTTENGRELNKAFFEMYVTLPTVAKMLTQLAGKEVTADTAKKALEDPTKIFEGVIDEVTAGQIAKKTQQLTMTVGDAGLKVNFNLTHFSAPNPSLKVKSSSAQQTLSVLLSSSATGGTSGGTTTGGATSGGTTTSLPANYVRTAASGAEATLTINKVYRKVGKKLTLIKTISGKKGTNRFVTVYKKTYSYVVKDAKGKVIPPQLSSAAHRFGLRYLS